MDFSSSFKIKTYENQGLSYFHLTHASPCLDMIATPLQGDAQVDVSILDFGPGVIIKRRNHGSALEEYQFADHVLALQLPVPDEVSIDTYIDVLGGLSHSPFLASGAKAQWIIPSDVWLFQLHLDVRWLRTVLGQQAMEDYLELSQATSRKAYDRQVLFAVASACEYAFTQGLANGVVDRGRWQHFMTDILLPCIMSDIAEHKSVTRQKILGRALDYVHEQFSMPISIEKLAMVASTSVRNLQIIFKQELGISPGTYIQQFRLHRFRHLLTQAGSVTEAAYASGFKHLGRLTERYARVFEQKPSTHLLKPVRDRFHIGALGDVESVLD